MEHSVRVCTGGMIMAGVALLKNAEPSTDVISSIAGPVAILPLWNLSADLAAVSAAQAMKEAGR